MTVRDFIRSRPPKGFKPCPFYSRESDTLSVNFEGADSYAESLCGSGGMVTLMRAFDDGRIVGVKIHDASLIVTEGTK